jgi:cyclopropane fatty-acyl-phospholipid synthase-like methyltransferase
MNQHSYDAVASEWDGFRTTLSPAEARLLALLCEPLTPGAHVLDLGCGTGRPIAEYLIARRLRVTGVDQSANMLAFALQRFPDHDWVLAPIDSYVPTRQYGAALAWDSLFHLPRTQHAAVFARVRASLPVGARFALTVGGSDHAPFTDTMLGQQFFYDSHPPDEALSVLRSERLEVLHSEFLNLPTAGRDKGRFAIVAYAA